jgi:hypothetical protein
VRPAADARELQFYKNLSFFQLLRCSVVSERRLFQVLCSYNVYYPQLFWLQEPQLFRLEPQLFLLLCLLLLLQQLRPRPSDQ